MDPGHFGFAVTARDWSADETYSPDFGSGSLEVGLAVTAYGGGTGQLTITDADGVDVFMHNLTGTVAQGNSVVSGRAPFQVHVRANRYSGIVSLGVSARQVATAVDMLGR